MHDMTTYLTSKPRRAGAAVRTGVEALSSASAIVGGDDGVDIGALLVEPPSGRGVRPENCVVVDDVSGSGGGGDGTCEWSSDVSGAGT